RAFRPAGPLLGLPAFDDPGVDHLPGLRDRVEVELIAGDLGDEKRLFHGVGVGGEPRAAIDVALPQLTARSDYEVGDALLRHDALVDVVVAGEHHADAVLQEERLERLARPQIRAVPVARR